MRRVPLALVALAAAALAVVGCGRRTPPVAPERRVPQVVSDLRGEVREGAIELSWVNPTRRVDGSRLRDLSILRVYRVEDAGTGEPRSALLAGGRIVGYTEIAAIRPEAPGAAVVAGDRIRLPDRRGLVYGRRYTYVVVSADSLGRLSPPSARAAVTFLAAPEPPADVVADAGDGEVRLGWRPPERLADGSPVGQPLAYEVLRAPGPDAPLVPVARTPRGVTRLTDRGLENDRTYAYAVRAVREEASTLAFGAPSTRVAVTPVDTTPPSPPTNLVAIPSEGEVRLAWSPSPEADVAGYVVYRADERGQFARVGSTRVPSTVFVDRGVDRGRYRYVVTAQDASVRANESARSNEVSVTVP